MTEKILTILEKNARIKTDDLANILGEDPVRVRQEVEKLESDKVICGYHTGESRCTDRSQSHSAEGRGI